MLAVFKNKCVKSAGIFALVVGMVAMTGCGTSGTTNPTITGVTGPTVSYVNGNFVMSVVLTQVTISGGGTVPIPDMPNSTLEVGPDLQSAGLLISVSLSATDIASLSNGDVVVLPSQSLPGGRALPGVAAGTLPAVAVEVPKWDSMVFYIGPEIFGVFVPVNMGLTGYEATFDFNDSTGTNVGQISIIGADTSGKNAGFLVMIPIKGIVGDLVHAAAKTRK
jgi:hypothetical protein